MAQEQFKVATRFSESLAATVSFSLNSILEYWLVLNASSVPSRRAEVWISDRQLCTVWAAEWCGADASKHFWPKMLGFWVWDLKIIWNKWIWSVLGWPFRFWTKTLFIGLPVEVLTRSMLRCRGIVPLRLTTWQVSSHGCHLLSCEVAGFPMTSLQEAQFTKLSRAVKLSCWYGWTAAFTFQVVQHMQRINTGFYRLEGLWGTSRFQGDHRSPVSVLMMPECSRLIFLCAISCCEPFHEPW